MSLAPGVSTVPAAPPAVDPRWRGALETVLDEGGLRMVAQPIVDVARARVAGYELLARFDGPFRATPDVWFLAAREHGLEVDLTRLALRVARRTAEHRPAGTFWTVNVEPHLLTVPAVRDELLTPDRLDEMVVELTEHVATGTDDALAAVLAEIRRRGGHVAMDDAGTGYSGLSQMLGVRPDVVKVDRSLVQGLDQDPVRRAVVRLLGDLAGRMDAWLLAEGVETEAELAEVAALGVPLVQGWALARAGDGWPDLAPDVRALVARQHERAQLVDHVLGLVRPTTVHGSGPPPGTGGPTAGHVVTDAHGRPESVVVADPAGGLHRVPALVVAPSTPPAEALARAMARDEPARQAPLVCTDARGRVAGTVSVAALVDALLAGA